MDKVSFSTQSTPLNSSTVSFVIDVSDGNGGNGGNGAVVCPNNPRLAKLYDNARKVGAIGLAGIIKDTCQKLDDSRQ